jgi:hypothetical protein
MILKPPSLYSESVAVLCRKGKLAVAWTWPLSLYCVEVMNSWSYAYKVRFLSTYIYISLHFIFPIQTVHQLKGRPFIKVVILIMIYCQPQSQCDKYVYLQHYDSCSGVDTPSADHAAQGPCRSVGSRKHRILNFPGIFQELFFLLTEATLDPCC